MAKKNVKPDNDSVAMSYRLANLKGKELADYIAKGKAIIAAINEMLQKPNHSQETIKAFKETRRTIEELLQVLEPESN